MKYRSETKDLYVPQFDLSVEDFISGMLTGKLHWSPQIGETLVAKVLFEEIECWKCHQSTRSISGIEICDVFENSRGYEPFYSPGTAELIQKAINNKQLTGLGVGAVKERYSYGKGEKYLSKGCVHCDALFGKRYSSDYPPSTLEFLTSVKFICEEQFSTYSAGWYFEGKRAESPF